MMKATRKNAKALRRFQTFRRLIPLGLFVSLLLAGIVAVGIQPWIILGLMLAAGAQSHENTYPSPDGAYIAIVRDVDTGAMGSYSDISLKSKWNVLPPLTSAYITDGPYYCFSVHWKDNHTLQVNYGEDGLPDKSWTTHWHGVKIVYVNTYF